ncbi:FAD binding domain-containing protein [Salidesulfovibrio onnuriiensis]|uniref:FAD binding domain-containing protein n=1 Tax=Salidesulfovibrio onnuriiensis TaxID=2583823 RepID=UPI0016502E4C|nr:FAD binding domain-containing protein [Salidesulfovibrio onnuriiensis]
MIQEFHRPESVEEAVAIRKEKGTGACFLAGGFFLNSPESKGVCGCAISLEKVGMAEIGIGKDDVLIGACATLQQVADNRDLPQVLRQAAGFQRARHFRTQITVGGDIASRRADSFTAAALMAMNATVQTAENGDMSVSDYVLNGCDDLIISVTVPRDNHRCCGLSRQTRTERGPVLMNAAVGLSKDGDAAPVVVVSGLGLGLTRLPAVEALLPNADLEALEKAAAEAARPEEHWIGSVEFRKHLCGVAVADCAKACK